MHVYLTAHMREGISARPGVTGGVTGSGGTSNNEDSFFWPSQTMDFFAKGYKEFADEETCQRFDMTGPVSEGRQSRRGIPSHDGLQDLGLGAGSS